VFSISLFSHRMGSNKCRLGSPVKNYTGQITEEQRNLTRALYEGSLKSSRPNNEKKNV